MIAHGGTTRKKSAVTSMAEVGITHTVGMAAVGMAAAMGTPTTHMIVGMWLRPAPTRAAICEISHGTRWSCCE